MTGQQPVNELLSKLRDDAPDGMWGVAVQYARKGGVVGVSDDGEEIQLTVKTPSRALPFAVWLWPDDPDWDCDCGKGGICVHVVAAAISLNQNRAVGKQMPEYKDTYKVRVRYDFTTAGRALKVSRSLLYSNGRVRPLNEPLKTADVVVDRSDLQAESLLVLETKGELSAEALRRLLAILGEEALATLDGSDIQLSKEPLMFRVLVRDSDTSDGFRIGLFAPGNISTLYRGAAVKDQVLRPTSHGSLLPEQRQMLLRGVSYGADEVAVLVGEAIPRLQQRVPVEIETQRLPKADALVPRVQVYLKERPDGLEVRSDIAYGDPPVALVGPGGVLKRLSDDVVPARDLVAERGVQRAFESRFGRPVGFTHLLPPDQAVAFLQDTLPLHDGPVRGKVDPNRFRVEAVDLTPTVEVARHDEGRGGWAFDVRFGEDLADPWAVLDAWRGRRSLVPLLDGGWAPLPVGWLNKHGALLSELLDARDAAGRVERNATAALVELLEDTKAEIPPDLSRLRRFLEGDEGLDETPLPDTLCADLRPYQKAGYEWLSFLRNLDLCGVLADDMGLGKTVQALAAMEATPGPHLVVAPTSVIQNWAKEAARFVPKMKVCIYHGPGRSLDESADLVLTSYALLRLDRAILGERHWSYCILDEAQAIKNPRSQTARAAFSLDAEYRLCLTGTPVENRLEELWSLFRFLMPGLLGSESSFKEGFVRPIENGDRQARTRLRNRVRPYVLRRLKSQVAKELPPLTEVVVRCMLSDEQRAIYDTVRYAAHRDVQRVIEESGRTNTLQVLEALLRMRQACCDPTLVPGHRDTTAGSSKLDRLEELLVEWVGNDQRCLVFSQWTSLLDRVETRLDGLGVDFVRLDGSTRDRQRVVDTFQSPDGPPVFLLSLKAGGTGLNLTAADYVVHLDPWWNPAVERQATDRAHRIGQDKPVVSCRLVAEGTVEERILELQDAKRDLADAALGTDGGFVRSLTSDELRSLFDT